MSKHIAIAYDGACYLCPAPHGSRSSMATLIKALDPFQNAHNEWRRVLTATATRY